MPALESFAREAVDFPRAVSPSPWTVPGHASLFTGLYPWEHRVHMKSRLLLDPSIPTIASVLGDHGYSSLALSANGLVGHEFGLLNGFDRSALGAWWEKFLRFPRRVPPLSGGHPGSAPPSTVGGERDPQEPRRRWMELGTRLAHPFVEGRDPRWMAPASNLANRVAHSIGSPSSPYPMAISPWIEPTLSGWLHERRPEERVFGFVNFLEPHEPYLADPRRFAGTAEWLRHARLRMDKTNFLAGRWVPTPEQFERLHRLYRDSLSSVDPRVGAVFEAFRHEGRWENLLVVVTADHGQAFGERGYLFHAARVWEPLLRVPLWVKWPDRRSAGTSARGWASLIDVAPTVFEACGIRDRTFPSALPLGRLIAEDRPDPVLAMADGLQGRRQLERVAPESIAQWDAPWIAAYSGSEKVVIDLDPDRAEAFDLERDPLERSPSPVGATPRSVSLSDAGRAAGRLLRAAAPEEVAPEIAARLQSWGYD